MDSTLARLVLTSFAMLLVQVACTVASPAGPPAATVTAPGWRYTLPNGDLLVAQPRAGAGDTGASRILLMRDGNGDGKAEFFSVFLENLDSPIGMELVGSTLYVANADAILRFDYREGQTRIAGPGSRLTNLPAGPLDAHWASHIPASQEVLAAELAQRVVSPVAARQVDEPVRVAGAQPAAGPS